ncbi:hypothetical protein [Bizionia sp.]|uniref:hypothetical protein n=1 Tax=Bizionia sp. TaxID=1954480 RepID=UPI003A947E9D
MKVIKIVCFSLFLLAFSCGRTVKTLAGIKDPKVESKKSVVNYLKEANINQDTYFLSVEKVKDTMQIYKNLFFGFNSDVFLFNGNSGSKYCYKGTEECSGTQMKSAFEDFESNYSPCTTDTLELDNFLNKLVDIKGNSLENSSLPKAEYYVFQTWNIYSTSKKHFKEDMAWIMELKEASKQDIVVIFVNTDLLDEWGLEKDKKLPMKFKKKAKEMTINFGTLPIEQ